MQLDQPNVRNGSQAECRLKVDRRRLLRMSVKGGQRTVTLSGQPWTGLPKEAPLSRCQELPAQRMGYFAVQGRDPVGRVAATTGQPERQSRRAEPAAEYIFGDICALDIV